MVAFLIKHCMEVFGSGIMQIVSSWIFWTIEELTSPNKH
jgi:hypothetical protein